MRKHVQLFVVISCAALFLGSGCAHRQDTVTLESRPSGATVLLDGQPIGVTPLETQLPTREAHRIELRKPHFKPLHHQLSARQDPERDDYLRFGLLVDAGHYRSFGPEPIKLELQTDLLPQSRGADPLATFAARILEADRLLAANEIDGETHRLIVAQIIAYFD